MSMTDAQAPVTLKFAQRQPFPLDRVAARHHPGCDNRTNRLRSLAVLVMVCTLWVLLAGSAEAGEMPTGDPIEVEGPYRNLTFHRLGGFRLSRTGKLVTVTLGASKSAVQYTARQSPEILFQVPPGFRPQQTLHLNVEGWPVSSEGMLDLEATIPHRFRVTVERDGSVRHVDGPELDQAGFVGYMVSASWPSRDPVGHFHNQEVHHASWHRFSRSGDAVQAVFGAGSSPVQHAARQAVDRLFKVPAGYRPAETVVLAVEGRHVDRDGNPLPSLPEPVRFRIQVGAEGTVSYLDGPELDEVGFLAYQVTAHWTAPPSPDFALPPQEKQETYVCLLHPVMQAAVLAALSLENAPNRDCTSVTRDTLATIEKLDLRFGLYDAPLQRADLAGFTGLRHLSIEMQSALMHFLAIDVLSSQPKLESLELDFYAKAAHNDWYSVPKNIKAWAKVPIFALRLPKVAFYGPDSFGSGSGRAYWIVEGDSHRRISGLLDTVPDLAELAVHASIRSCDAPLAVGNPNLRSLTLTKMLCVGFPTPYLYHLPMLERLTVQSDWLKGLPIGFLDRNPHLQYLAIEFSKHNKYRPGDFLGRLPHRLLANNPRLKHLTLVGDTVVRGSLPEDLFHYSSELREVHLMPSIPVELLPSHVAAPLQSATPELTVSPRALEEGQELAFRNLTELDLHFGFSRRESPESDMQRCYAPRTRLLFRDLTNLNVSFGWPDDSITCDLPNLFLPNLRTLSVSCGRYPERLVRVLRHAPQLTNLSVCTEAPLPPSLFSGNRLLKHLSVGLWEGATLPDDFLTQTPDLEELRLGMNGDELTLPTKWLRNVPHLQVLSLWGPEGTEYPLDLVDYSPNLRNLKLEGMDEYIPYGVGSKTPNLEYLDLHSNEVTELPDGFLRNTPVLKHIRLRFGWLESLPQDFLSNAPELEHVEIWGTVSEFPEEFLARSHKLKFVSVGNVELEFNGGYTLAEWLESRRNR